MPHQSSVVEFRKDSSPAVRNDISQRGAGLREHDGAVIPKRAQVVNHHVILCALRNLCHTGPVLLSSAKIPRLRFGMTSHRAAGLREHNGAVIPKRAPKL